MPLWLIWLWITKIK